MGILQGFGVENSPILPHPINTYVGIFFKLIQIVVIYFISQSHDISIYYIYFQLSEFNFFSVCFYYTLKKLNNSRKKHKRFRLLISTL